MQDMLVRHFIDSGVVHAHASATGGKRPIEETHDKVLLLELLYKYDESSQETADRYKLACVLWHAPVQIEA